MLPGFGLGLGLAFDSRGVFAAGPPFGVLCREALSGLAGSREQFVQPRCPGVMRSGLRRHKLALRTLL